MEHQIKMGRDAFFDLLARNSLLVRKRKRQIKTTNSHHWLRKYPNLIKDITAQRPNEIWVSDITYWKINSGQHLYISLITDAYSRQIVGYHVANTLNAIESVQALKMALSALGAESHFQLTHHSDRGVQYCSQEYVKLLQDYDINISMTENGDPLENAIAERVNGILKDEYLDNYDINNIKEAKELIKACVNLYNNERPHLSISMLTPSEVHQSSAILNTNRLWKNYYTKDHMFVNSNQD
jgi:transposase InsO family protein